MDIVHGNDLLDIYGPIAGRLSKIPTVQHCRMILSGQAIIKKLITWVVYHINTKVVTISHGVTADMFSIKNKLTKNKVTVCHDWLDGAACAAEKTKHKADNWCITPVRA